MSKELCPCGCCRRSPERIDAGLDGFNDDRSGKTICTAAIRGENEIDTVRDAFPEGPLKVNKSACYLLFPVRLPPRDVLFPQVDPAFP